MFLYESRTLLMEFISYNCHGYTSIIRGVITAKVIPRRRATSLTVCNELQELNFKLSTVHMFSHKLLRYAELSMSTNNNSVPHAVNHCCRIVYNTPLPDDAVIKSQ